MGNVMEECNMDLVYECIGLGVSESRSLVSRRNNVGEKNSRTPDQTNRYKDKTAITEMDMLKR